MRVHNNIWHQTLLRKGHVRVLDPNSHNAFLAVATGELIADFWDSLLVDFDFDHHGVAAVAGDHDARGGARSGGLVAKRAGLEVWLGLAVFVVFQTDAFVDEDVVFGDTVRHVYDAVGEFFGVYDDLFVLAELSCCQKFKSY